MFRSCPLPFLLLSITVSAPAYATADKDEPAQTKPLLVLRGHTDSVRHLVFAPEGKVLASSSVDGTVRLWDVATGKALRQLPARNKGILAQLAFSPDGKMLATYGRFYDSKVRLWEPDTGKPRGEFDQHPLPAGNDNLGVGLAFARSGKMLAVASLRDTDIVLWDTATMKERTKLTENGWVDLFAFSPDGKILAVTSTRAENGDTIRLWNVQTGRPIAALPKEGKHDQVPTLLRFSPDGTGLVELHEGTVRLWDVTRRKLVKKLVRPGELVTTAFAPGGEVLVVERGHWPNHNTLDVWAVKADKPLRRFRVAAEKQPAMEDAAFPQTVPGWPPRWMTTPCYCGTSASKAPSQPFSLWHGRYLQPPRQRRGLTTLPGSPGLIYLDCTGTPAASRSRRPTALVHGLAHTVSTPLKWSEVRRGLDPGAYDPRCCQPGWRRWAISGEPVLGPGIHHAACLERLSAPAYSPRSSRTLAKPSLVSERLQPTITNRSSSDD